MTSRIQNTSSLPFIRWKLRHWWAEILLLLSIQLLVSPDLRGEDSIQSNWIALGAIGLLSSHQILPMDINGPLLWWIDDKWIDFSWQETAWNDPTIDQLISAGPPNTFFGSLDQSAPNPEPGWRGTKGDEGCNSWAGWTQSWKTPRHLSPRGLPLLHEGFSWVVGRCFAHSCGSNPSDLQNSSSMGTLSCYYLMLYCYITCSYLFILRM